MKRFRPDAPVAAVEALIFRGPAVLLIRRKAEPHRGKWSPPGGAIDLGESVRHALVREVHEETGLRVTPGEAVDVVDVRVPAKGRPDYHYVVAAFLARQVGGELRARSDAAEARWVPLRDLAGLRMTTMTRRLIAKARRHM